MHAKHPAGGRLFRMLRSSLLLLLVAVLLRLSSAAGEEKALRDVLFGSCLDTHEHPMLDRSLLLPRDLFLFMGDNIYADRVGPSMRERYALLKESSFFKGLRCKGELLATWDDHDFGKNDGGASYEGKAEAQSAFYDWLDEPKDSARRARVGVYDARTFGPVGKRLQIILLDTRTFRSDLQTAPKEKAKLGGRYMASSDESKTMLGAAQWAWLEEQLRVPAELRLVVSSIQFAAQVHGGECWGNLPHEQQRMMKLIQSTGAAGVIFLSGDRHWCEYSRIQPEGGYALHDFTSSSMTQKHARGTPTPNENRFLAKTYHEPNVGHLHIDWDAGEVTTRIMDVQGATQLEHKLKLSELRPQ
jgi:alkaline phosphatase D